MLGEFNNFPVSNPADPEHRDNVSGIPNKTEERFDWPNDLIDRIKRKSWEHRAALLQHLNSSLRFQQMQCNTT